MRPVLTAPLLGAAVIGLLGGRAPAAEPTAAAAAEQVLDKTAVGSPERTVGEVRLIRRGDRAVVQTVLRTKLLPRVVAEIRKKEQANWPLGREGDLASARYVGALESVAKRLRDRQPAAAGSRAPDVERRLDMLIEFVLDPNTSMVQVGTFVMEDGGAEPRISPRPMFILELPREYVRENMRLIVADSFHVDGAALEAKVAPLGLGKTTEER
jgi:hypothetical protein